MGCLRDVSIKNSAVLNVAQQNLQKSSVKISAWLSIIQLSPVKKNWLGKSRLYEKTRPRQNLSDKSGDVSIKNSSRLMVFWSGNGVFFHDPLARCNKHQLNIYTEICYSHPDNILHLTFVPFRLVLSNLSKSKNKYIHSFFWSYQNPRGWKFLLHFHSLPSILRRRVMRTSGLRMAELIWVLVFS